MRKEKELVAVTFLLAGYLDEQSIQVLLSEAPEEVAMGHDLCFGQTELLA